MDDTAICLSWDKNFGLTPLGQAVVYGELRKIYQEKMEISECVNTLLGQTLKNHPYGGYPY